MRNLVSIKHLLCKPENRANVKVKGNSTKFTCPHNNDDDDDNINF